MNCHRVQSARTSIHHYSLKANKLQKLEDALLKHMLTAADLADMDDRGDMGDRGDMHDMVGMGNLGDMGDRSDMDDLVDMGDRLT